MSSITFPGTPSSTAATIPTMRTGTEWAGPGLRWILTQAVGGARPAPERRVTDQPHLHGVADLVAEPGECSRVHKRLVGAAGSRCTTAEKPRAIDVPPAVLIEPYNDSRRRHCRRGGRACPSGTGTWLPDAPTATPWRPEGRRATRSRSSVSHRRSRSPALGQRLQARRQRHGAPVRTPSCRRLPRWRIRRRPRGR